MGEPDISDVYGASPVCIRDRCQFSQAVQLLEQARKINQSLIDRHDRSKMSQALWCDSGGHAFSKRDPGRQRITVNMIDEDTGEESTEGRDFCGDCADKAGLLAKKKTRPVTMISPADSRL